MSKHHRTAGVNYTLLNIGERTYKLRPITLGDYAEMESHILATNFNHDKRHITDDQASQFENSRAGLQWLLWKCLQTDHPEFDSFETVQPLFESLDQHDNQHIAHIVKIASGSVDIERMIWPQAENQSAHDTDLGCGWPDIYKFFVANYGWTPDQVNQLTCFQFAIYAGAITPEHRRVTVDPDTARSILQQSDALPT